jgi:hypothetical protein
MRSYTVHRRRRTLGNPEAEAEATVFVRDGFSWPAFVVPVLWALYHRLWLVLVGYAVIAAGLNFAVTAAGFPNATNAIVSFAIQVLFAAEAHDLRRWTLARRGHDIAAVIIAEGLDEAETRYFREWSEALRAHRAALARNDEVRFSFRPTGAAPAGGAGGAAAGEAPA